MASPPVEMEPAEQDVGDLGVDASDGPSRHTARSENAHLASDELSKAFAKTLSDAQSDFQAETVRALKMRLEQNSVKLRSFSSKLEALAVNQGMLSVELLKKHMKSQPSSHLPGLTAAYKVHGPRYDGRASAEKRCDEEADYPAADGTLLRLIPKQVVKLDAVQNVPPYISWVFVQKNEYITEDLPVIGHQRIYYDERNCAIESVKKGELEEVIHFSRLDDSILMKMIQKHGLGAEVLEELATIFHISCDEVKERYDAIQEKNSGDRRTEKLPPSIRSSSTGSRTSTTAAAAFPLDHIAKENIQASEPDKNRSLKQAMDAFECLFCRRCLVFDCVLHGCSQELALPTEVTRSWTPRDVGRAKPCSDHCVLMPLEPNPSSGCASCEEQEFSFKSKQATSSSQITDGDAMDDEGQVCVKSREDENIVIDKVSGNGDTQRNLGAEDDFMPLVEERTVGLASDDMQSNSLGDQSLTGLAMQPSKAGESGAWTILEKDLLEKALQVFGKNSCLISQTLLRGWKTCIEVSRFVTTQELCSEGGRAMLQPVQTGKEQDLEVRQRAGGGRRKSRSGRKGTGSSMTNALRQRLSDLAKRDVYTNYNPCGCFPTCGKDCPCKLNATCCEKICGCASSCKYRFRGCNCAKGHCSTRNCPCFAASRECDPDVCRRCWISCGDRSSLGPPQREDICDCHNMPLFLRQKQRVLLGRSSIVGWGAFLKNPVEKNTFLGEYTGELITHDEAERRGRKYDHEGRSYLFNLNNEFCIDAYRKGDKLKFANHSSHPNCFAKIVLVSGDHRVGIFAKERICAGEELFYDYDYAPESCPDWAVKSNEDELRQSKQYRANSKFAGKTQQPRKIKKKPAKKCTFSDP